MTIKLCDNYGSGSDYQYGFDKIYGDGYGYGDGNGYSDGDGYGNGSGYSDEYRDPSLQLYITKGEFVLNKLEN